MSEPTDAVSALKDRLGRLADLGSLNSLAHWDQQTKMPVRGGESRASALATLAGLSHDLFVDDETGRLLADAGSELAGGDPDDDEVRMVALVRRQYDKARRVPSELASELAHASSAGQEAWVGARAQSDFSAFEPSLARNVELLRAYVDCHLGHDDGYECPYDVLLDDYEPRMRTAEVARLFSELRDELLPVIGAVTEAAPVDERPLHADFPVGGQRRLVAEVLDLMGFDPEGWRLDDTVHPFATKVGYGDVRVTTRWEDTWWPTSLFGAMHECGHGLYEDGIAQRLRRTPVGTIESLGMHESQSRMWENMVGRSRAFAGVLAPRIGREAGGELAGIGPDALFAAVNRVKPTFIRIEADEATYALHIILRFELEQALIDGTLAPADAAQAWRETFERYLGLPVSDDGQGILQDVHWSAGLIGYFPTYALGNLIAGQLWEQAETQLTDLDGQLAAGELAPLREWLREHVHQHGSKYPTTELLEREAGGAISVAPFMRYLKDKLGVVYGVSFPG